MSLPYVLPMFLLTQWPSLRVREIVGGAEVKSGWRAINDRPYRVRDDVSRDPSPLPSVQPNKPLNSLKQSTQIHILSLGS